MGRCMQQRWEQLYYTAVLETDWSKLRGRIEAAEAAIEVRLHEFSLNHGGTPEENLAIKKALQAMDILRNDLAVWQSPQQESGTFNPST
jgi:hypothetical protein